MQNFTTNYPKLSSATHTFLATFIVTFVGAVASIPADTILSGSTWTTAFLTGLVTVAIRAAVKAVFPSALALVGSAFKE